MQNSCCRNAVSLMLKSDKQRVLTYIKYTKTFLRNGQHPQYVQHVDDSALKQNNITQQDSSTPSGASFPPKSLSSCQWPFDRHLLLLLNVCVCVCACSFYWLGRLSSTVGPLSLLPSCFLCFLFFCVRFCPLICFHTCSLPLHLCPALTHGVDTRTCL